MRAEQAGMPMAVDEEAAATPLAPSDYGLAAQLLCFFRAQICWG